MGINHRKVNLIGKKFGRLTVIEFAYVKDKRTYWLCQCDCGNSKIAKGNSLNSGLIKSCGCIRHEHAKEHVKSICNLAAISNTKHGLSYKSEYNSYTSMIDRCTNENSSMFPKYGGLGVTICKRWLESVENFYTDMGDKPSPLHSLDRIDVNGNYEPSNCRWATRKEQNNNQKRTIYVEYDGCKYPLAILCEKLNVPYSIIKSRFIRGWSIEKALNTPVRKAALYTINGETKNVMEWSSIYGIDFTTVYNRLKKGWSIENALSKDRLPNITNNHKKKDRNDNHSRAKTTTTGAT